VAAANDAELKMKQEPTRRDLSTMDREEEKWFEDAETAEDCSLGISESVEASAGVETLRELPSVVRPKRAAPGSSSHSLHCQIASHTAWCVCSCFRDDSEESTGGLRRRRCRQLIKTVWTLSFPTLSLCVDLDCRHRCGAATDVFARTS
jgi:hypothetical protein